MEGTVGKLETNKKEKQNRMERKNEEPERKNASQMRGMQETPFNVTGNTNITCLYISNMLFKSPHEEPKDLQMGKRTGL